jgi:malonate transporter and related proteins
MIDVLNLALPYFGLIFIGFACGKLKRIPDTALAWMNFFIAAPCALFTLGVAVALRPLKRMLWEVPFLVAVKLVLHPELVLLLLSLFGSMDQS